LLINNERYFQILKNIKAQIKNTQYKVIISVICKQIILFWKIDKIHAKHYDFTDEELDFIINYDIKYRMGSELRGGE
jgi:hypothetical protein